MYLGVHTTFDVFLGLILSGCMLWINWHLLIYMDRNPQKDRLVVLGIMVMLLLLIAGVFLRSYPEIAGVGPNVVANSFVSFFLPIGWFCGFLLGWLIERRKIHFTIPHGILPRGILSLLGLILLLGLQAGFGVCPPASPWHGRGSVRVLLPVRTLCFCGVPMDFPIHSGENPVSVVIC